MGQGGGYRAVLLVLADPAAGRHRGEAAAAARHLRVGRTGVQGTVEGTRFATADSRAHRQVSLLAQSIIRHNQDPRYPRQNRQSRLARASGPFPSWSGIGEMLRDIAC